MHPTHSTQVEGLGQTPEKSMGDAAVDDDDNAYVIYEGEEEGAADGAGLSPATDKQTGAHTPVPCALHSLNLRGGSPRKLVMPRA